MIIAALEGCGSEIVYQVFRGMLSSPLSSRSHLLVSRKGCASLGEIVRDCRCLERENRGSVGVAVIYQSKSPSSGWLRGDIHCVGLFRTCGGALDIPPVNIVSMGVTGHRRFPCPF